MSEENAFLEQIKRNIQGLLSEKKYKEAYQLCNESIQKYPNEKTLYKLKNTIEETIRDENKEFIKNKLKELKPLWKEKKYTDILKNLRELLKIDPANDKIKREYIKAEEKYRNKIQSLQKNFIVDKSKKLDKLLGTDEDKLLQELFKMEKDNPGNKNVALIANKYKTLTIKKRIHERQDLIYSEKYDAIEKFIKELKKIDPENVKIKELEKNIRQRRLGMQIEEKGEFVYKGEQHLQTLIKLKKFDKAIKVAEELLDADKNNKTVEKALHQAQKGFFNQTKEESIDSIIKDLPKIQEEYKTTPKNFIKI